MAADPRSHPFSGEATGQNAAPIVAFFGTKGGVGKTTISARFAELVTQAGPDTNVLAVDLDIEQRGLTVTLAKSPGFNCLTMHDLVAERKPTIDAALDVSNAITRRNADSPLGGRLWLVPSATRDSRETYRAVADITYTELYDLLHSVIASAVQRYDIACVVIDCGPVINPYTAAAAHLADRAFIIGQNEPISFESLQTYTIKVREFFPEFNSRKMSIILNKVRGPVVTELGVFKAIPFTIDIVDMTEGLEDPNLARVMLFDRHVLDVVERTFEGEHDDLVPGPEVLVPSRWIALLANAPRLLHSRQVQRYRLLGRLLPGGLGLAIVAVLAALLFNTASLSLMTQERIRLIEQDPTIPLNSVLIAAGLTRQPIEVPVVAIVLVAVLVAGLGFWARQRYRELTRQLRELEQAGARALFEALEKESGRRVMDNLNRLSRNTRPA